ncbi:MAG: hypothetical protein O2836_01040 [Proteobacteria bacterium]|nr:hypothetical protein [Pseudomonadota bacterium]
MTKVVTAYAGGAALSASRARGANTNATRYAVWRTVAKREHAKTFIGFIALQPIFFCITWSDFNYIYGGNQLESITKLQLFFNILLSFD